MLILWSMESSPVSSLWYMILRKYLPAIIAHAHRTTIQATDDHIHTPHACTILIPFAALCCVHTENYLKFCSTRTCLPAYPSLAWSRRRTHKPHTEEKKNEEYFWEKIKIAQTHGNSAAHGVNGYVYVVCVCVMPLEPNGFSFNANLRFG